MSTIGVVYVIYDVVLLSFLKNQLNNQHWPTDNPTHCPITSIALVIWF